MKNILAFGFIAMSLTSCMTSRTMEAQRIVETDFNQIRDCKTLGEISGRSSLLWMGMAFTDSSKAFAKNEALNQAATMGATHVVWTLAEGTWGGGRAAGVAYKCAKVAAN